MAVFFVCVCVSSEERERRDEKKKHTFTQFKLATGDPVVRSNAHATPPYVPVRRNLSS